MEGEDADLLVMRNVFSHRLHVHRKYDLKVSPAAVALALLLIGELLFLHARFGLQGSLVSREASFKEKVSSNGNMSHPKQSRAGLCAVQASRRFRQAFMGSDMNGTKRAVLENTKPCSTLRLDKSETPKEKSQEKAPGNPEIPVATENYGVTLTPGVESDRSFRR